MNPERAALRTINHVPAMLAYWGADERCVFANEAYREWFAQDPEKLPGMTMRELLGPLYERNLPYIKGALAGIPQYFEREITRPDESVRRVAASYTPDVRDGTVVGFTAHIADITALHQRQEELLLATELLDRTGTLAKVGGAELQLKSGKIFWTKEMFRILDLEPGEPPPAERWVEFFEGDALAQYLAHAEEMRARGTAVDHLTPMITAKGRRIFVRIQADSVVENGEVVKLFAAHQDITEQELANQARRELEQFSLGVLNSIQELVAVLDQSGIIVAVNDAWQRSARANGASSLADGAIGLDYVGVLDGAAENGEANAHEAALGIREVLKGEREEYVSEYPCSTAESTRWFQMRVVPYVGPRRGAVVTHRDITSQYEAEAERTRRQNELHQAQKLESIGRLAGGVAHDYNNMLSVILGHAELALMRLEAGERPADDLDTIRITARRSADLTRQLLAFARRQLLSPTVIDVNGAIQRVITMLARLLGENVSVVWRPNEEVWAIHIDPTQLHQILTNLCLNARDAIEGVGTIEISATNEVVSASRAAALDGGKAGDFVRITVRDSGHGMDAETLAHIFEPFYTTKGPGEGTGLGLATVYGVVRQSGGFIAVQSSLGVGTAFDLYFPRHDHVPAERVRDASEGEVRPGSETILVVEDDAQVLRLTTRMLEREGYRILAATSPFEALRLAREYEGHVDLLLTDVIMPHMNGKELASALQESDPTLECIFISGYPADVVAGQALLEKDVHFLQKPCPRAVLLRKVRDVLDGRGGRP